jgi:hypothetical protein
MRGWNAPIKMDPLTVQVAEKEPHEYDLIEQVIMRVARGEQRPGGGNGDVGVPSVSGEKEPSN